MQGIIIVIKWAMTLPLPITWLRNMCMVPKMQHLWTGTRLAPLFYWHWWKSPEKLDGQEEKQGRVFTTNPKHGTVLPATSARADFSEIKTLARYYCINCAGKMCNLNRKYFFSVGTADPASCMGLNAKLRFWLSGRNFRGKSQPTWKV